MSLRLTPKQAADMGIHVPVGVKPAKGTQERRRTIIETLRGIREARCDVVINSPAKRALIRILHETVPSLNEVLRYDTRSEFYSINKAWHTLITQAAMASRPRRLTVTDTERVNVHVHAVRKRLLDPDNLCIKSILDAIVRARILPDDAPEYVGDVTVSQAKGKTLAVFIEMVVVPRSETLWEPDSELLNHLPIISA